MDSSIKVDNINFQNFSENKKKILLYIKKNVSSDLETLAKHIGMTKMGIHKHVMELEGKGLLERFKHLNKNAVGRPKLHFRLAVSATDLFPRAYTALTCTFLDFIKAQLGDQGIDAAFKMRQDEVYGQYSKSLTSKDFASKVKQLAKVRDKDGYMVELKTLNDSYELLEYNCPIVQVAEQYSNACFSENQLFEQLLGTEVEMSHRIVAGDKICKFNIKIPKN